jgi:3' exoribonuclease family, domain 1
LNPDSGLLDIDVDFSPSCNLKIDERRLTEHGTQVAEILQRCVGVSTCVSESLFLHSSLVSLTYYTAFPCVLHTISVYTIRFIESSGSIDLKGLCIIPGKYCWCIGIDILVLEADGDPLDACSIATYVALNCTKIPKVELFAGESGQPEDFEVCGDIGEAVPIEAANVPICVTSCKVC